MDGWFLATWFLVATLGAALVSSCVQRCLDVKQFFTTDVDVCSCVGSKDERDVEKTDLLKLNATTLSNGNEFDPNSEVSDPPSESKECLATETGTIPILSERQSTLLNVR